MKIEGDLLFTSFIRPYREHNSLKEHPSHIAEFYIIVHPDGEEKLFATSSDRAQSGMNFYVGKISSERIEVDAGLSQYTRIGRNVVAHANELIDAYLKWKSLRG